LLPLATTLLRARRLVARLALLGAVLGLATGLVKGRTYTAHAAFMPQSRRTNASLSGLAAQFGLALPTADGTQSPAFYSDLVTSRELLKPMLDSRYGGKTLEQWLEPNGSTAAIRRERLIDRLTDMIDPTVAQKTGVVRVNVTAPDPVLAAQLDSALLYQLNRFNLESRQSQASAERRFTEQRLAEVRVALAVAEDRLRTFLESNRGFAQSPQLTVQQERLNRDVTLQQQLFLTLSQAYEQAKIEEVRDTPVITILERPEVPVRPDSRKSIIRVIVGMFLGMLVGVTIAMARAADRGLPRSAMATAWRDARTAFGRDLRRPWRLLGRGEERG
jgi:uncharacterized protein involved in exopolysaccharide biosynthesis